MNAIKVFIYSIAMIVFITSTLIKEKKEVKRKKTKLEINKQEQNELRYL